MNDATRSGASLAFAGIVASRLFWPAAFVISRSGSGVASRS
jgi:hypothetical protein